MRNATKNVCGRLSALLSVVALTLSGAFAEEVADPVAAEARDWYENVYAKAFVEGDENFYDFYADTVFLELGEAPGYLTREAVAPAMDAYVAPWVASGWSQSELKDLTVKRIGAKTVFIKAWWSMATDAGDDVTGCPSPAWTYLVSELDEGWRVVSEFEAPCETND